MPSFTTTVEQAIHAAIATARTIGQSTAEVMHILLEILEDPDARALVQTVIDDMSVIDFRTSLGAMIRSEAPVPRPKLAKEAIPSAAFQRVVQRAAVASQSEGRQEVTGADILQSILTEWQNLPGDITVFLSNAGLTHQRVVAVRSGTALPPVDPAPAPAKAMPPSTPSSAKTVAPKPLIQDWTGPKDNPQNPLSLQATNLNGHINYVDPPLGVSFPSPAVPDPVTQLNVIRSGKGTNATLKNAVFSRSQNTCHFCGLRSKKYMEIVAPLSAATTDAMLLACTFCAQVAALDLVSSQRSGVLVYLPEFGQAELNAYARIIYVCRISQGPSAKAAQRILGLLMTRRDAAQKRFGTNDPYDLASMVAGCTTQDERSALLKRLDGIRLFPLDRRIIKDAELEFNQFPQILAYWRSKEGPFGGLTPPQMDLRQFEAKVTNITG
ncbi:hypothetical protein [Pelagibius sp. Alg239-R121]|uniref:hypothetical protein n=1 Tax=Pelagibius sp. Alg239-R121 TaxID=2993448 RepID=UPI0024A712A9|nr:hypothetical protein [Pelagibius sp. Alg239-R121]